MLGERSAERRDNFLDAGLRDHDRVHITLDHDHPVRLARGGCGPVEIVEGAPLVEERRLRRVQIFGLTLTQYPPAKGDDAAALVADRDHQPAAEAIIALACRLARLIL